MVLPRTTLLKVLPRPPACRLAEDKATSQHRKCRVPRLHLLKRFVQLNQSALPLSLSMFVPLLDNVGLNDRVYDSLGYLQCPSTLKMVLFF